jgi:hypothetical protein
MQPQGLQEYDIIFQDRFTEALTAAGANIVNQYEAYVLCHPLSGVVPWLRLGDRSDKGPSISAIATR